MAQLDMKTPLNEQTPDLALQFSGAPHPAYFHDADEVAAHVVNVLANWPLAEPAAADDATRVIREPDGYFAFVSPFSPEPMSGLSDVGAACGVIVDAAQSFLSANPDHLCLHSATFEIAGRLVVMTGTAHAGKSTLAARMAAEDVLVYCDDMLPLTAPDNLGLALGLPPRPRLPLPASAGAVIKDHIERHAAASDGKYCYLDTTNLAQHGRTAPIGAIILLDRRADGPAGFAPASRGEALRHLILRNMVRTEPASAMTARLHAVLNSVPCVKLHYSRLDDAAALLMHSFAAWPVDEALLLADQPDAGTPLAGASNEIEPPPEGEAVNPNAPYKRASGISARQAGDETFLFDANDISVLNLNPLATAIWTLLEEPITIAESTLLIGEIYPDVPRQTIERDVTRLFSDLAIAALIVPDQR